MTSEQTEKLIYILREAKQIVNRSISDLCELGEQALYVLSENKKVSDDHGYSSELENCFINIDQLANRLGVSKSTINKKMKIGLPVKHIGSRIVFDFDEVIEWFESQSKNSLKAENKSKHKFSVVK